MNPKIVIGGIILFLLISSKKKAPKQVPFDVVDTTQVYTDELPPDRTLGGSDGGAI